ncbi:MAG: glycosyltransferase family 39 protein [Anaerolineae bacterium]|nr:glycosyltransferase family 39 protein [Anaerolineae bacterium]
MLAFLNRDHTDTRRYPDRRWWLALGLIVIGAAALRFTGYNFSLPYVDHQDEPNFYLSAQFIIDTGSARPFSMQGYPPGIITLDYLFQRFFSDPTLPPSQLIHWVRLISITASLGTLIVIALTGARVGPPLAGLIGAAIWAFTPVIVRHSRYATADPYVTLFALLALYQVLTGLRFNRNGWITAGIVSLMLATAFKYQAIFWLPLLLGLALWRLTMPGSERRAVLAHFGKLVLLEAAFLFWLVALYPSLEANQVPYWVAPTTALGLPSLATLADNLRVALSAVWLPLLWIGGLAGLLWLIVRPLRRVWFVGLISLVLAALIWWFGVSLFGVQDYRQFFAFYALLMILLGVGWALTAQALGRWLVQRGQTQVQAQRLALVIAAALTLLIGLPHIAASVEDAREHTLFDRRNALAHWMDISLPPGGFITNVDNHKTFNRQWGGYNGEHDYTLVEEAPITAQPIADWRALGVDYAIMPYNDYLTLPDFDQGRAILDDTLLLKSYPPAPDVRGPSMVVLRLAPIQHPAEGTLGTIHLLGYDLSNTRTHVGEPITFTLYWRADAPTDAEYTVFNHLRDASGAMITQVDGPPLPDVRRPTTTWDDPQETLVSRTFTLNLLDDLTPGTYTLVSGFYRPDDGSRLTGADGATSLTIAEIEIAP